MNRCSNWRLSLWQIIERIPNLDSIQLVARLDTSIDEQALRLKAIGFLSDRQKQKQALSRDLNESELEYKKC